MIKVAVFLILKFIHIESNFDQIILILQYFLYHDKLIDNNNYLV
uniref:Uncharacterized protein n=1 Tax=Gracilariopsis lemaneiformis TaxID=2782 RepID=A0A0C5DLU9_GRALE|nr:hypothetical protein [Gracilariopsis lemaneiformis]AJO68537.1 hypothetical protein [Gracilariopsis lemaneiformis]AML79826.1 hypothetical protein [Gracilariopsis lemaneiformis]